MNIMSVFDCEYKAKKNLSPEIKYGESNTTFSCEPVGKKMVQYENTYRMAPERKFQAGPVKAIIEEMFENNLHDKHYDPISCALTSKAISQDIKNKVKALEYDRYKIVCLVTIGEKKDQSVQFGSRCVWNTDLDTFASASYSNAHIYAVGIVYALYYE